MSKFRRYQPMYSNSWALIVGVNDYSSVPPLQYAANDANAVGEVVRDLFAFPDENVTTLIDSDASLENIRGQFMRFADSGLIEPDDRILFYFAGHGFTRTNVSGSEVGFLVPVDGVPEQVGSILRWDELTKNAELIPAKHILFVMDACYGGLAVTRSPGPGSTRFAADMIRRHARQVITAGKADEPVADAGGPRAGHSVFTGHLLDAMEGEAASTDGIVTANTVMAYVYDRVSRDSDSRQTPHFGFLDGDGDLVLNASLLGDVTDPDGRTEGDVLVSVPAGLVGPSAGDGIAGGVSDIKEYLSDPRHRIALDDHAGRVVKRSLELIAPSAMSVSEPHPDAASIVNRLGSYREETADLRDALALMSKWANDDNLPTLLKCFRLIADRDKSGSGKTVWIGLQWYPLHLLLYECGIAALSGQRYDNLYAIQSLRVNDPSGNRTQTTLLEASTRGIGEAAGLNVFKLVPGHEKHFVPMNEHLFKVLQPELDDLLQLGGLYEELFDRYEVLTALSYLHITDGRWCPMGRFAWKHRSRDGETGPLAEIIAEAGRNDADWVPLKAGFFGGSKRAFDAAVQKCLEAIGKLNWF